MSEKDIISKDIISKDEFCDLFVSLFQNGEIDYRISESINKQLTNFQNLINILKEAFDICVHLKRRDSIVPIIKICDLVSAKIKAKIDLSDFRWTGYSPYIDIFTYDKHWKKAEFIYNLFDDIDVLQFLVENCCHLLKMKASFINLSEIKFHKFVDNPIVDDTDDIEYV